MEADESGEKSRGEIISSAVVGDGPSSSSPSMSSLRKEVRLVRRRLNDGKLFAIDSPRIAFNDGGRANDIRVICIFPGPSTVSISIGLVSEAGSDGSLSL